jgi:DNA-binding MltR family transcriptional regulator
LVVTLESDLKALKALKALSKGVRSPDEFHALFGSLNHQTDNAVALICSALLEEATEQLLLNHMVKMNSDTRSELFRGTGPLATLSARTKLAFALVIIGPVYKHNLELLREVRNAIAHARKPISFQTPEVTAVCKRLKVHQMIQHHNPLFPDNPALWANPRDRYITASLMLWASLTPPITDVRTTRHL